MLYSEDEFDTYPTREFERRRLEGEDESVDVLTTNDHNTSTNTADPYEDSFVLPILLNIDDSEDDDLELLRVGPGGYREKGARDFEDDGVGVGTPVGSGSAGVGVGAGAAGVVGGPGKKRRR